MRDYQESLLKLIAKASENPLPHENIPESSNSNIDIKENFITESHKVKQSQSPELEDTEEENVEHLPVPKNLNPLLNNTHIVSLMSKVSYSFLEELTAIIPITIIGSAVIGTISIPVFKSRYIIDLMA